YGHSLRSTHARVREVVPSRRTGSRPVDQGFPPEARSAPRPALAAQDDLIDPTARRGRWRGIAIGSAAMFVVLLTVITGVEVVVGRPISDVVRGESGSGTSLFGGTQPAGDGGT